MRLDGFGLFVEDLGVMIPFYRGRAILPTLKAILLR